LFVRRDACHPSHEGWLLAARRAIENGGDYFAGPPTV
jgi:hypothetical protein